MNKNQKDALSALFSFASAIVYFGLGIKSLREGGTWLPAVLLVLAVTSAVRAELRLDSDE